MARITVEDCLDQIPNRFLLVMIASKRTKQLYKGAYPLIENKSGNKKVVLALREIADGKIEYDIPSRKN
ncbi:MAG: DNA-directed RNA polymerase subunit omega [Desulfuromonas sp.]|mgnify:CR=1 FL=1|nr:MAG: DNA-directed RNA polymerase subunit omega [Desulfuromonas sp.]